MKLFAKVNGSSTMSVAVLTCLMLAGSISAFAVHQSHTAKAASAVTVVTEGAITLISSTSLQNLSGATATITVPAGMVQLVDAEITADSSCQGAFAENYCIVKILADVAEMDPVSSGPFDGVGTADDWYEGHAMQRSILLGPGKHTIPVQAAVTLSGMDFFLNDWSLTITQYNNGK